MRIGRHLSAGQSSLAPSATASAEAAPSPKGAAEPQQVELEADAAQHTGSPVSGGLFHSDYSKLPKLTNDMEVAKRDIDVYGYCLWANALSPEQVRKLSERVIEQADAEVEAAGGESGALSKGSRHFMSSLVNKGDEFTDLLVHPEATELLGHMLGEMFNLSTGFCNIVKPGATAEQLHTDQWW